jgi:hypothetical protein
MKKMLQIFPFILLKKIIHYMFRKNIQLIKGRVVECNYLGKWFPTLTVTIRHNNKDVTIKKYFAYEGIDINVGDSIKVYCKVIHGKYFLVILRNNRLLSPEYPSRWSLLLQMVLLFCFTGFVSIFLSSIITSPKSYADNTFTILSFLNYNVTVMSENYFIIAAFLEISVGISMLLLLYGFFWLSNLFVELYFHTFSYKKQSTSNISRK